MRSSSARSASSAKASRRRGAERCFEEGLLRRVPPSPEGAREGIDAAERWLGEAERGIAGLTFAASVLSAYLAMFHAARAVLLRDGVREKSHWCVARYLEDRYVASGRLEPEWVLMLDHFRETRHEEQYGASAFATEREARDALGCSRRFVARMGRLLGRVEGGRAAGGIGAVVIPPE